MYHMFFTAGTQFLTQQMDVFFNIFGISDGIGSPDVLEDDLLRQTMPRVACQQFEQFIFAFAERKCLPVAPHLMSLGIKHQVSNLEMLMTAMSGLCIT